MATQAQAEAKALSRLARDELARVPGGIGDIHGAVSGRVFGALGPAAAPVRLVHDAVARGSYGGVRGGLWLAGGAAGALAGRRVGDRPLSSTPRGAAVIAALNGLYGDRLAAEGSPLALPMAIRVGGEPVAPEALARAFPDATGHLVVFLHGLGETEFAWGRPSYGERLRAALGATPVSVRFNSGRHVSENGAALAELLDAVVARWPVPVERISIVGHSMGGLVARSACHHGGAWTRDVREVVSLGTPHLGAPLEQAVHRLGHVLALAPETRPFARGLRRRSAGIRDLRHGSLVDSDWRDTDPDALWARACAEVPLLEGVTHYFVAATVTRDGHPAGRLLGDTLVLTPSASGRSRTRRLGFEDEHGLRLGRTHHLALLNHPEVYARLERWLA